MLAPPASATAEAPETPAPECPNEKRTLETIAWSPDNRTFLTSGPPYTAPDGEFPTRSYTDVWSVEGKRTTIPVGLSLYAANPAFWSPDSTHVFFGNELWRRDPWKLVLEAPNINRFKGLFTPDSQKLFYVDSEAGFFSFDLKSRSHRSIERGSLSSDAIGLAITPDGKTLLRESRYWVALYNARTNQKIAEFEPALGMPGVTLASPNGAKFLLLDRARGSTKVGATIFDAQTRRRVATLSPIDIDATDGRPTFQWSRDGSRILWVHDKVSIYDANSGAFQGDLGNSDGSTYPELTPDPKLIRLDHELWDITTLRRVRTITWPSDSLGAAYMSSTEVAIIDSEHETLRFEDLITGSPKRSNIESICGKVRGAFRELSPNGQFLPLALGDGSIVIVRVSDGKRIWIRGFVIDNQEVGFIHSSEGEYQGPDTLLGACVSRSVAKTAEPGLLKAFFAPAAHH